MPKYAAFLRAINLGSNRRISSADLRSLFEGLGFEEVASFRTSGNVVFSGASEPRGKITGRIETALSRALGDEVQVFLRTAAEIRALARSRPFARKQTESSKGKLQVVMLSTKPSARPRKEVLALATDANRLAFGDRELYWLPSGGVRDSRLDFRAIEALLGSTTMRTKGTIDQLAATHFGR